MVWSDQAGGATRHMPGAARLLPDPRAHHYWDGDRMVGRAYQILKLDTETIDLEREAWDAWLLFDRRAKWSPESPPQPAWWEHQLYGAPPERLLDPVRFAEKAAELRRTARRDRDPGGETGERAIEIARYQRRPSRDAEASGNEARELPVPLGTFLLARDFNPSLSRCLQPLAGLSTPYSQIASSPVEAWAATCSSIQAWNSAGSWMVTKPRMR